MARGLSITDPSHREQKFSFLLRAFKICGIKRKVAFNGGEAGVEYNLSKNEIPFCRNAHLIYFMDKLESSCRDKRKWSLDISTRSFHIAYVRDRCTLYFVEQMVTTIFLDQKELMITI